MLGETAGEPHAFDTIQNNRIASVDGLRALAFLLVFAFHSWEFAGRPWIPLISNVIGANTRPDLFVVITGFALYLPFALDASRHDRFSTRPYLQRRLKRIVVPYYAALLLALGLPYVLKVLYVAMGSTPGAQPTPDTGDVLTHLTFTHLFFPQYWSGINGSLWTMSLEMQLYLLFPVFVVAIGKWGYRALIPLAAVSIAWHLLSPFGQAFPNGFLWGATAIGRLTEFVAGMLAAVLVMRHRARITGAGFVGLAALLVTGYLVATSGVAIGNFPVREVGLSVAFGSLVVLAIGCPPMERLFGSRPMARLGYLAYSMFLVHQPVVYYFSEALRRVLGVPPGLTKLALLWTVGLGIVLAVGWVFFRLIEEPCIRWAKRVESPQPPEGAVGLAA